MEFTFADLLVWLSQKSEVAFVLAGLFLTLALTVWVIPKTTDWMVNSAAGLAGKHLGNKHRTLVINASTNNPEVFAMVASFFILRVGGIATPLGSNFANIYLMYLVAPLWVLLALVIAGRKDRVVSLGRLIKAERGLVAWHVVAAGILFLFSSIGYYALTGIDQFQFIRSEPHMEPSRQHLLLGGLICLMGVIAFLLADGGLKRRRPELYEEIDSSEHIASWGIFAAGTLGLIVACFLMNSLFLAWSEVYGEQLSGVFGPAVFAGLHYFVGSLVTSLPEMRVAIKNYRKVAAPDLHTALGSASYSNAVNLAIAAIGSLVAFFLLLLGIRMSL